MTDFDDNSLFERIKGIICECLSVSEDAVELDTNLFQDLNADSLDLVDLISAIEAYMDYYTNKRVQRNLGVLTPMEFHEQKLKKVA